MSLLRAIQNSAVNSDTSVEALLLQCVMLGARLHLKPLTDWTQLELNGYPSGIPLPPYRARVHTQVLADVAGAFGSGAKNAPLASTSIPDDFQFVTEHLFWTEVRQRVSEIEALLATGETTFQMPWPQEILAPLQGVFYQDMIVVSARQIVPATIYSSALSGIRARVLQFALDIEAENPDAGEAEPGDTPVAPPVANQIFNQNFFGDYATVGNAGRDVSQDIHEAVDLDGLEVALRGMGVTAQDQVELLDAVREEQDEGRFPGSKSTAWLTRLEQGGIQLGSGVAIGTATDLLVRLLGIG